MGSLLGLPVSGIEALSHAPLLRAADAGPVWLTGGAYGVEGGAACTLAIIISTIFLWRTRLLSVTPEMLDLTDKENPKRDAFPSPQIHESPAGEEKAIAETNALAFVYAPLHGSVLEVGKAVQSFIKELFREPSKPVRSKEEGIFKRRQRSWPSAACKRGLRVREKNV
ncbi:MAG: hypothetical protein ICV60_24265, partial [Pyrinomonadaceae bacterium]|nr:hypothetical protein [Pyrinomonadaceae bacterium]